MSTSFFNPRGLAGLVLASLTTLGLAAVPAQAQTTISFGTPVTVSSDSDVFTTGTLFGAYAFGNANATSTVNGVTFTKTGATGGGNLAVIGLASSYSAFTGTGTPYANLSAGYQQLLSGAIFASAANTLGTLTITGLKPTDTYEAQFFVQDPRTGVGTGATTGRTEVISGAQQLIYNNGGAGNGAGGVGQYALGTFTAPSGTATFTIQGAVSTQVNAFQVRDITATPEPSQSAAFGLGLLGIGGLALKARKRTPTV